MGNRESSLACCIADPIHHSSDTSTQASVDDTHILPRRMPSPPKRKNASLMALRGFFRDSSPKKPKATAKTGTETDDNTRIIGPDESRQFLQPQTPMKDNRSWVVRRKEILAERRKKQRKDPEHLRGSVNHSHIQSSPIILPPLAMSTPQQNQPAQQNTDIAIRRSDPVSPTARPQRRSRSIRAAGKLAKRASLSLIPSGLNRRNKLGVQGPYIHGSIYSGSQIGLPQGEYMACDQDMFGATRGESSAMGAAGIIGPSEVPEARQGEHDKKRHRHSKSRGSEKRQREEERKRAAARALGSKASVVAPPSVDTNQPDRGNEN
ncbi:hypothetical protein ABW19_dt0206813 [Dactylella cylindrospora]|nr:hypothetical protein ABW19_dt0206813 [Dactylella cylindrospora]